MFCMHCGKQLGSGASPCPSCGGPVTGPAPVQNPSPAGGGPFPSAQAGPASPGNRSALRIVGCLVIGLLALVAIPIVAAIAIPAFVTRGNHTRRLACRSHLRQIAAAVNAYQADQGEFPPSLREIYGGAVVTDPMTLTCPLTGSGGMPAGTPHWDLVRPHVAYEYRRPKRGVTGPVLLCWDSRPHPDGSRCVVDLAGETESILDESEFQRRLAATGEAEAVPAGR
ncbi:MAG: zinc ribbon domain-containing protein [Candidatus Brocadiae bacterium]|nr:zinc ribbon domain-containing protein [Candidatus Brocadiia bacterium]